MSPDRSRLTGTLIVLVAAALFATLGVFSRVAYEAGMTSSSFVASAGDSLNRFGVTGPFAVAKFIAVVLLLAGFLVSIEAFREVRIPFTRVRLARVRHEPEQGAA